MADATQNVTDKVKDLHLDDVTGERVSKTELKKRQKAREKDAKKAEREATKQPPPQPKKRAQEDEGELNANVSPPFHHCLVSTAPDIHEYTATTRLCSMLLCIH